MSGTAGKRPGRKSKTQGSQQLTRRQFLKEVGLVMGGAAVASLPFTSACSSSANTNPSGNNTNTSTNTTTTTETSLPPAEGFVYKTPLGEPPKMAIPGCTTFVATDRKYVVEHMWIKMVAENIAAIGITEKMVELLDLIRAVSLPDMGDTVVRGEYFGYIEAAKMNVEFPAPVSGTVLQVNNAIYTDFKHMISDDPYVRGWLVTVQLNHPEEWDELLTPQEYTDLNAKVAE